ncbi:response regulator transcription factor [Aureibaculum luteum]|uniref:response regulator transcription factor n=1 Tax=Aureibaculum luteum TaxID=1548456 RepID=UPI000E4F460B|nr:LuxR C-terminal-related transcriptional regulator [Aureibaculum luteum]
MRKAFGLLFLFCTIFVVSQSRIDTITFNKNSPLSNKNKVYNSTQYELQKFNAFKIRTSKIVDKKKYLSEIHSFTKDSLQILAVKLISIKELSNKKLLIKDIHQNRAFYITILADLKESEISPNEYLFLENILSKITITEVETKYAYSKWLNIILGISLIGFLIFAYKTNRKETTVLSLSKQETTVKNLILKGKSNKEIAQELFISLSTVKSHISHIYHKLNVSNRDELSLRFKNGTSTST